jgi:hypothetical protein
MLDPPRGGRKEPVLLARRLTEQEAEDIPGTGLPNVEIHFAIKPSRQTGGLKKKNS